MLIVDVRDVAVGYKSILSRIGAYLLLAQGF